VTERLGEKLVKMPLCDVVTPSSSRTDASQIGWPASKKIQMASAASAMGSLVPCAIPRASAEHLESTLRYITTI
jgi:hypothetical protein